jgi:hypothetical protein
MPDINAPTSTKPTNETVSTNHDNLAAPTVLGTLQTKSISPVKETISTNKPGVGTTPGAKAKAVSKPKDESKATEQAATAKAEDATVEKPADAVEGEKPADDKEPELSKEQRAVRMDLIRREKAVRQSEEKVKQAEKQSQDISDVLALGKKDVRTYVEKMLNLVGVTPVDYMNLIINDQPVPQQMQVDELVNSKFEAYQKQQQELAEKKKLEEEKGNTEKQEKLIEQYKNEVSQFTKANEADYPLLSEIADAGELIFETWKLNYEKHGKNLTNKEVCDQIEAFEKAEVEKKLAKLGIKSSIPNKAADKSNSKPESSKATATKTLTNKHVGSSAPVVGEVQRPKFKNDQERIAWFTKNPAQKKSK